MKNVIIFSSLSSALLLGNVHASKVCDGYENQIKKKLSTVKTDIPFTMMFGNKNGKKITFNRGNSNPQKKYKSASTSKMVTGAIILKLVEEGKINLAAKPSDRLSFWSRSQGNDTVGNVQLKHLLNFTSGMNTNAMCVNAGRSTIEKCAKNIYRKNKNSSIKPGEVFSYSNTSMQTAGLMAMESLGLSSWTAVFNWFKKETGTFPNASYDLPSRQNPRLAGGMHWTTREYFDFIGKFYRGEIISKRTLTKLSAGIVRDIFRVKKVDSSPAMDMIGEDWRYGYGFWLECHARKYNCKGLGKISSPGAYGAYPFIDYKSGVYGVLGRQGKLGTFPEGYNIYKSVEGLLKKWATCG